MQSTYTETIAKQQQNLSKQPRSKHTLKTENQRFSKQNDDWAYESDT